MDLVLAPTPPEPAFVIQEGLCQVQFPAMGTTITLLLPDQQQAEGTTLVKTLFEQWEETLSRFRAGSELSRLNRLAGKRAIVSELLFNVLQEALAAARATNGIYDPTLLPQLNALGYNRSFNALSPILPGQTYAGRPGGGWQAIQLDPVVRCVQLPRTVQLDFGGIAKGMAVDAALELLRHKHIQPAMVNAGGDLAVVGVPPAQDHWSMAVPGKEGFWTIPLHHGAIATSGIARRRWRQGHNERHHLLDPRTGLPVQNGLWSVTVVAARCIQAEVAAKAAFILGQKDGMAFLSEHQLAGLFINTDSTWKTGDCWPEHLMRSIV